MEPLRRNFRVARTTPKVTSTTFLLYHIPLVFTGGGIKKIVVGVSCSFEQSLGVGGECVVEARAWFTVRSPNPASSLVGILLREF